MYNHEPELREVFTLTLREAQYHCNTCPQYILHQRDLRTKVGTRIWNHLHLRLPHHQHVIPNKPSVQGDWPCGGPTHRCGWRTTGSTTTLDLVGTTLHLVRVTPNQIAALQRVGTHHVPFLQQLEWLNKSVLERHM